MEYNSIGSLLSREVWNLEIVMVSETVYHYLIYRESSKAKSFYSFKIVISEQLTCSHIHAYIH